MFVLAWASWSVIFGRGRMADGLRGFGGPSAERRDSQEREQDCAKTVPHGVSCSVRIRGHDITLQLRKSPAQSRRVQRETDTSAAGDNADPHKQGNGSRNPGRQRRGVRRGSPTHYISTDKQMKDRHVDSRQDQKDEISLKIRIVCVARGIGGKKQRAC